jgi:hypothetical protein
MSYSLGALSLTSFLNIAQNVRFAATLAANTKAARQRVDVSHHSSTLGTNRILERLVAASNSGHGQCTFAPSEYTALVEVLLRQEGPSLHGWIDDDCIVLSWEHLID